MPEMFSTGFEDLVKLSKNFGEQGAHAALDTTESAIDGSLLVVERKLKEMLKSKWPNANIDSSIMTRRRVKKSTRGITGTLSVSHISKGGKSWIEVLMLGKDVPPHTMPARRFGPYKMEVGKKGRPKKYSTGPNKGKGPPVFISGAIDHPGYKGKDLATPLLKLGQKTLQRFLSKAIQALTKKLAKGTA